MSNFGERTLDGAVEIFFPGDSISKRAAETAEISGGTVGFGGYLGHVGNVGKARKELRAPFPTSYFDIFC